MSDVPHRYELLEELLSVQELFGFSIPNMRVVETLVHNGFRYDFYFLERHNSFLTFYYDMYQERITKEEIEDFMYENPQRMSIIKENIHMRIIEKHERLRPARVKVKRELKQRVQLLRNSATLVQEELVWIKAKEEIEKKLAIYQEQLRQLEEEIEHEKMIQLDETISDIMTTYHGNGKEKVK